MNRQEKLDLYRWMAAARQLDSVELSLTHRGEAFFHVSGAGHESSAALALHLTDDDWLHCHYRDKALMLARGLTVKSFLDSLLCNGASHSQGRQMSAHMCDASRNVMSIVGPVGNSALQAVGVAAAVKNRPRNPLVLCSVGDGTTQEGEFLEACSEAVREQLPVLFLIEDNGWAISTTTREKTIYSLPGGKATECLGMPVTYIDGRDPIATHQQLGQVVEAMRATRAPAMVVLEVDRLTSHTNADDQRIYRTAEDIARSQTEGDPLLHYREHLLAEGVTAEELAGIDAEIAQHLEQATRESLAEADPQPTFTARQPLPVELTHPSREVHGEEDGDPLVMREALERVLRYHLEVDPRVTLFGEDIEDPKGDVFGVTKGLSQAYPGRVVNSPLSESTIVGKSIGRALAGERPVAFLQFADFLPLAYNQITSELGSMFWRTGGEYRAPVIVMIPCGGLRPGLGPFHAQTLESIAAHTPGVDVFMPSTAADAAGLLNAAFRSSRPTLFFYPKSCLNDSRHTTPADVDRQFVPIGPARRTRGGSDITMVAWGNTVALCEQVAEVLEPVGIEAEILDLRTISPWDEKGVLASAEKTARLLVVHEDNHTCGLGGEVLATVAERARAPVAMRRVTRPDTFVPCNFANQLEVLPSFQRVLSAAADLLDLELTWESAPVAEEGVSYVEAIGSGPADETVVVVELQAKVGDRIECGDVIASLEASKSVFELNSPQAGVVEEVLAAEGETIEVGKPILRLSGSESVARRRGTPQTSPGTPRLRRRHSPERVKLAHRAEPRRQYYVGLGNIAAASGSRHVTNQELLAGGGGMTPDDIIRRTGIRSRYWVQPGETAISLAVQACQKTLAREELLPDDIDLLICATTTPTAVTPSMACQVLHGLGDGAHRRAAVQAYDINAACSGYLYALQAAYDYLQSEPAGRVLVVTTEVLSPLLDRNDLDTAILFGDAASATVLHGEEHLGRASALVKRPILSARGEDGHTLRVPFHNEGFIQMQGRKVFSEAVRSMISSLNRACRRSEMEVGQLARIVPHQANQRILDAIASRVNVEVYSNIADHGNTSSTSIPLCLTEVLPKAHRGELVGLCAFGGGFTFGAGILEIV